MTYATRIMFLLDVTGLDPQSAAALGPSILSRPHAVFLKGAKAPDFSACVPSFMLFHFSFSDCLSYQHTKILPLFNA